MRAALTVFGDTVSAADLATGLICAGTACKAVQTIIDFVNDHQDF